MRLREGVDVGEGRGELDGEAELDVGEVVGWEVWDGMMSPVGVEVNSLGWEMAMESGTDLKCPHPLAKKSSCARSGSGKLNLMYPLFLKK